MTKDRRNPFGAWLFLLIGALAIFAMPLRGLAVAQKGVSAEGAANTTDPHGSGEHSPLLPSTLHEAQQFFLTPTIWTLVIFLIMLAILYPMAWKPVLAGLKAREQRIRDDIANAERTRQQSEETLKKYDAQLANAQSQIREMLAKAQADGEKLATNIRMQAQREAEEAKERAQRDIEASKNAAIGEIYNQAAELATNVASKILRRNLNADDQRALVRESLDQLQTVK
jgi:F-type H+-transporting ATPase subunit b